MKTKIYTILFTLLFSCTTITEAQAGNYVIINQVMYDTPENELVTSIPHCNGEFVELYNGGLEDVSLAGWSLHGGGTTEIVTFADTVSIPSGGYMIVAYKHQLSPSQFTIYSYYDLPQNSVSVVYHHSIILKNDEGETLTLYNANSDIVDQITYMGGNSIVSGGATNPDTIQGRQCLSLHRIQVEFDPQGHAVNGTAQWVTDTVTFSANMLSQPSFYEHSLTGSRPLPLTDNYIVSVKPLDATTRVTNANGNISTSSCIRTQTAITYYDGFGRPYQTTNLAATPEQHDLVSRTDYAGLKRQTKQWLPVPANTKGQPLSQDNFQTRAVNYYDDNRPFVETLYENSALNRVTGQRLAGQTYENHPSSYTYQINSEDDNVRRFEVTADGALQCLTLNYANRTLYKSTAADEDGVAVTTFTDILGRTIAERRDGHYTYYVYDRLGRLRFVLPHIADSRLTGTLALNDTILQRAAYCYKYDSRGNMTYKRLPGAEPQLMVYDMANHLVLQQNGNQRAGNKWIVYAYDSIGRNLYSAEKPLTQTHEQLISFFANRWQVEHFYSNVPQKKLGTTGYASTLLGNTNIKPLIVNYYDDYAYLQKLATTYRNAIKYKQRAGYGQKHDNAVGMLTGTRVYNLADNDFTTTTYYYDYKGRIIQSHSNRNAGGYMHQYAKYNFDGTVAQQLTEQGTDEDLTTEHYAYTYDHAGRLLTTAYRLNDEPELQLSEHSYDDLGRLVQNLRHDSSDTLRYGYDLRGALTNINNYTYSERLFYADSLDEEAIARYNGNIAEQYNIIQSDTGKYSFRYDSQNRYTFSEKLVPRRRLPMESITYDARGNIRSFVRYRDGVTDYIDHLVFDYAQESNQVKNISDYVPPLHFYDDYGYYDQHRSDTVCDMQYDANGNLIVDRDRKIRKIAYNYLNLPDTIYFDNGNLIINNYDASGRKYRSTFYTVLATVLTPFTDPTNYNYTNDSLDYYVR